MGHMTEDVHAEYVVCGYEFVGMWSRTAADSGSKTFSRSPITHVGSVTRQARQRC